MNENLKYGLLLLGVIALVFGGIYLWTDAQWDYYYPYMESLGEICDESNMTSQLYGSGLSEPKGECYNNTTIIEYKVINETWRKYA